MLFKKIREKTLPLLVFLSMLSAFPVQVAAAPPLACDMSDRLGVSHVLDSPEPSAFRQTTSFVLQNFGVLDIADFDKKDVEVDETKIGLFNLKAKFKKAEEDTKKLAEKLAETPKQEQFAIGAKLAEYDTAYNPDNPGKPNIVSVDLLRELQFLNADYQSILKAISRTTTKGGDLTIIALVSKCSDNIAVIKERRDFISFLVSNPLLLETLKEQLTVIKQAEPLLFSNYRPFKQERLKAIVKGGLVKSLVKQQFASRPDAEQIATQAELIWKPLGAFIGSTAFSCWGVVDFIKAWRSNGKHLSSFGNYPKVAFDFLNNVPVISWMKDIPILNLPHLFFGLFDKHLVQKPALKRAWRSFLREKIVANNTAFKKIRDQEQAFNAQFFLKRWWQGNFWDKQKHNFKTVCTTNAAKYRGLKNKIRNVLTEEILEQQIARGLALNRSDQIHRRAPDRRNRRRALAFQQYIARLQVNDARPAAMASASSPSASASSEPVSGHGAGYSVDISAKRRTTQIKSKQHPRVKQPKERTSHTPSDSDKEESDTAVGTGLSPQGAPASSASTPPATQPQSAPEMSPSATAPTEIVRAIDDDQLVTKAEDLLKRCGYLKQERNKIYNKWAFLGLVAGAVLILPTLEMSYKDYMANYLDLKNLFDSVQSPYKIYQAAQDMFTLLGEYDETRHLYTKFIPSDAPAWKHFLKLVTSRTFKKSFGPFDLEFVRKNHGEVVQAYECLTKSQAEIGELIRFYGEIDAYVSMAELVKEFSSGNNNQGTPVRYSPVEFVEDSRYPMFEADYYWNPMFKPEKVIPNIINLGKNGQARNVIVTGANAGGKSGNLKAILTCIIMAQTFGFAPAQKLRMTVFSNILATLKSNDDAANNKSRFQVEAYEMAKVMERILATPSHKFTAVFSDELFAGTEVEPAIALSRRICLSIAGMNNVMYMLATHYKELTKLEVLTNGVFKNFKVEVIKLPDGSLFRPYKLVEGIGGTNIAFDVFLEQLGEIGAKNDYLYNMVQQAKADQHSFELLNPVKTLGKEAFFTDRKYVYKK